MPSLDAHQALPAIALRAQIDVLVGVVGAVDVEGAQTDQVARGTRRVARRRAVIQHAGMEALGQFRLAGGIFLAHHRKDSEGAAALHVGDHGERLPGTRLEGEVYEVDPRGRLDNLAPVAAGRLPVRPADQIRRLEAQLQAAVLRDDIEGLAHQRVGARQAVGCGAFDEVVIGLPRGGGGHWTASPSVAEPGQPVYSPHPALASACRTWPARTGHRPGAGDAAAGAPPASAAGPRR